MVNLLIAFSAALVAQASAECTREALKAVTADFLAAQTGGKTAFTSLSDTVSYNENRKKVDIKSGVLSKALKIDYNRTQHDPVQCAAFAEIISSDSANPYVIGAQLRIDNTTGKVSQIDSIVTTKGDWLFNVTGTLYWAKQEKWDLIPADKRDSYETIKKAGDAYCDLFNDKSVKVPWGSPCARLEGGMYTGKGQASDRCDVGVPSGVKLVKRTYVVDEEYGTVDIQMNFGGDTGLPDSHEFRVESAAYPKG
ncbi:hypothetical protein K469DRAFT_694457 [Zopfia rhizophila CBS 207.26]|uniref:DUF8021 domain-containing protein n=1 Tax=Zopfia rhizophila CBS 207.26 TaxID=1314779 RepID=A0A6A6EQZ9_9PEZI|nr:hypothetical protein K469DRAFT_694457 [Zopfia rhizophila CBS 207.26]